MVAVVVVAAVVVVVSFRLLSDSRKFKILWA